MKMRIPYKFASFSKVPKNLPINSVRYHKIKNAGKYPYETKPERIGHYEKDQSLTVSKLIFSLSYEVLPLLSYFSPSSYSPQ